MKILVDTSVIIDFLRRKDKAKTLLYTLAQENDLYVSIITHTEIYAGKSIWVKQEAQAEVEELFSGMSMLPLVTDISKTAGKLKAENHDRSLLDCIIAATAKYHDLELATFNTKDFEVFAGLQFYAITS